MKPYNEIASLLAAKDPVLKKAMASVSVEIKPALSTDIYLDLMNSIVSQQLSVKVVRVIWNRFIDLFPDRYPHAAQVLAFDPQHLRSVGLSNSKVKYLQNVAAFSMENPMSFKHLNQMSNEAIIEYLTQIKGVGKWTVQMILMFPMDRLDVFPVDDLGLQNQMKLWYSIDLEKKALRQKLIEISDAWRPYQSLASKYLWEAVPS